MACCWCWSSDCDGNCVAWSLPRKDEKVCWCTPEVRTPWCGRPECHAPGKPPPKSIKQLEEEYKKLTEKKVIHQGWECPKCHCIWSPDEKKCTNCEPPKNEGSGEKDPQLLVE